MRYALATSSWDKEEYAAMQRVISSGSFTMGDEVLRFEEKFADLFRINHAVMSNSGSSANLLAFAALKYSSFKPREGRNEVIVPAVSWSTSFYPVSQMGYTLKFVDIDIHTLNASVEKIKDAISERTAGVLVVNLLGNPSALTEIRTLASQHEIFMVEDNCESMGALYDGKLAGTFGDIGTFSSFFSHHISTMEGGVSVTQSEELSHVMTSLRAHGWTRELPAQNFVFDKTGGEFEDLFRFVLPGYNLRPLEFEGAIGKAQLEKLPKIIQGRRENASRFMNLMTKYPEILIQEETGQSSWFGFSMVLSGSLSGRRQELIRELNLCEIAVRPIVGGNFTRNPVLRHLAHCDFPDLVAADKVHDDGLFVGNHHYEMSDEFDTLETAIDNFIGKL